MIDIGKPRVLFALVTPHGLVWTDGMASTKGWATRLTQRTLGKRRMELGTMRAVRVTVELATDAEAAEAEARDREQEARKP
jgi:hypothetical protein